MNRVPKTRPRLRTQCAIVADRSTELRNMSRLAAAKAYYWRLQQVLNESLHSSSHTQTTSTRIPKPCPCLSMNRSIPNRDRQPGAALRFWGDCGKTMSRLILKLNVSAYEDGFALFQFQRPLDAQRRGE